MATQRFGEKQKTTEEIAAEITRDETEGGKGFQTVFYWGGSKDRVDEIAATYRYGRGQLPVPKDLIWFAGKAKMRPVHHELVMKYFLYKIIDHLNRSAPEKPPPGTKTAYFAKAKSQAVQKEALIAAALAEYRERHDEEEEVKKSTESKKKHAAPVQPTTMLEGPQSSEEEAKIARRSREEQVKKSKKSNTKHASPGQRPKPVKRTADVTVFTHYPAGAAEAAGAPVAMASPPLNGHEEPNLGRQEMIADMAATARTLVDVLEERRRRLEALQLADDATGAEIDNDNGIGGNVEDEDEDHGKEQKQKKKGSRGGKKSKKH